MLKDLWSATCTPNQVEGQRFWTFVLDLSTKYLNFVLKFFDGFIHIAFANIHALVLMQPIKCMSNGSATCLWYQRLESDNLTFDPPRFWLAYATVDNSAAVQLSLDLYSVTGSISIPAASAEHALVVEIMDTAGSVRSRTTSSFSVKNNVDIALELERVEPVANSATAKINDPINLYFTKAIDPALLTLEVRETVHGFTYDRYSELVEVHRDQELVPGGASIYPGNNLVSFYPSRDLSFNATVFVNVIYNGSPLQRYVYHTVDLPTMAQGTVLDGALNAIAGIEVSLPEAGLTTVTDAKGSFGFGFKPAPNDPDLKGGRYRMVINPKMKLPGFGTIEVWANIEDKRFSVLPMVKLPVIDKTVPFRFVRSGDTAAVVGDGSVTLGLANALLQFPDHSDKGNVHVQWLDFTVLPHRSSNIAIPFGMYHVQPTGIQVTGALTVSINMPKLFGGYDYVPADGSPILLLGFDSNSKRIVPVGVGRVNNRHITSEGALQMATLDYIGFSLVMPESYPTLEAYVRGEISLQQLRASLGTLR